MTTTYGIISDIHGAHPGLVKAGIEFLVKEGVDKLILNGDLVGDRFPDPKLDEQNYLAIVLGLAGESGLETSVLEESHECVPLFQPVIKVFSEKFGNVIDVMKNPKIEGDDHDIVFLAGSDWHAGNASRSGGYHLISGDNETGMYNGPRGETIVVQNMNDLKDLATNPEKTIVFSHIPKRFDNPETGVDMANFYQGRVYHRDVNNMDNWTYTESGLIPGYVPKEKVAKNNATRVFDLDDSDKYVLEETIKIIEQEKINEN